MDMTERYIKHRTAGLTWYKGETPPNSELQKIFRPQPGIQFLDYLNNSRHIDARLIRRDNTYYAIYKYKHQSVKVSAASLSKPFIRYIQSLINLLVFEWLPLL